MRVGRGLLLGLLALASSGCFVRAQGGYQTSAIWSDPGGGQAELSAGKSDFRATGKTFRPIQYGIDLVAHAGESGQRLGLGLSALWAPLSGWSSDWSPTVRLGGRPLQLEWGTLTKPSVSVLGEVGLAFFPDRHPTRRAIYSVSAGIELFGQQGVSTLFQHRVYVLTGVTFDLAINRRPLP